jgi:hypothetical protein
MSSMVMPNNRQITNLRAHVRSSFQRRDVSTHPQVSQCKTHNGKSAWFALKISQP